MGCCGQSAVKTAVVQAGKKIKEAVKQKFATPDVRADRILLCHQCPKLQIIKKDFVSRCRVCSCIVEGKTWLKDEHCPLNKW